MMNISQIFEEHGTNIILLDSDLGTAFGIVKIDKETFELRIEDLNVDEFKSLKDLENAGCNVLRLNNGKFVTDYL